MRIEDLDKLVLDRTQEDATRIADMQKKGYPNLTESELEEWNSLCSKGALNVSDMNRVVSYIPVLQQALVALGFTSAGVSIHPAFDETSSLYLETMTSIQQDIETLRTHFYALSGYAELVRGPAWNYEQSNALEQNLEVLSKRIQATLDVRVHSAQTMVTCGGLVIYAPLMYYTLADCNKQDLISADNKTLMVSSEGYNE